MPEVELVDSVLEVRVVVAHWGVSGVAGRALLSPGMGGDCRRFKGGHGLGGFCRWARAGSIVGHWSSGAGKKEAPGLLRGLYNSLCLLTHTSGLLICRPLKPADKYILQGPAALRLECGAGYVTRW